EETPTPTETETPDGTVTPTEEPEAPVCGPTDKQHPVGARIAATYGLEYEMVIGWHCEGYGFGQIMLALQTSALTELPAEDLLQMKTEQGGWGRVWQGLGLIGRAKEAEAPTEPVDEEPTDVVPTDGETVEPSETPTLEEGEGTEEAAGLNDQTGKEKKSKDKDKDKSKDKDKGKHADPTEVVVETLVVPDETDQPLLTDNAANDKGNNGNNGKSDKNDKGNSGKSDKNDKGNSGNAGNAGKGPGRK
ncbi:MAG TPA: hypothetical protein VFF68_08975, partial [Anaerolineaceae bacterium]|nr:hypothetical protein [Anaerolineaceae bacterium]